jgi:beta-lactamase regulating signal transducer with metallopeptidase domain
MTVSWGAAPDVLRLLLEGLIKSTIALSCGLLLVRGLPRSSAALKHFILAVVLAGLLVVPVLLPFRFGWETRLLPASPVRAALGRAPGGPAGIPLADGGGRIGSVDEAGMSNKAGRVPLPAHMAGVKDSSSALLGMQPKTGERGFPGSALVLTWAAGLLAVLWRLGAGLRRARRLTKEGQPVRDPGWRAHLDRLLSLLRLRRSVRLKSHERVAVPMTWGVVRPVIMIPSGHEAWTEDRRSSALLHELSHIKRSDFPVMMLVRLSLALFWFNPLAWVAFGRLKREQEKACDELVLRTGLKPSTYAASLLLFKRAAGPGWDPAAALLGIAGGASLNERLAAILARNTTFKEVAMKTKIMIGFVALLAVTVLGTARPAGPPLEKPEAASQAKPAADDPVRLEAKKGLTIVITKAEGSAAPVEVTLLDGTGEKTLKSDGPLTLELGDGGELKVRRPEGEAFEVIKGNSLTHKIKEGRVEIRQDGKVFKVQDGGVVKIIGDKARTGFHVSRGSYSDGVVWIGKGDAKWKPEPTFAWTSRYGEDELKGKLKKIRETLEKVKAKELEISELDRAITELEKELEGRGEVRVRTGVNLKSKPGIVVLIDKNGEDAEAAFLTEEGGAPLHVTIDTAAEGTFSMVFEHGAGGLKKDDYEAVVAAMKKALPDGYAVEPEYDEAKGKVLMKFSGPSGKKGVSRDLVAKILKAYKDAAKTEDPGKK